MGPPNREITPVARVPVEFQGLHKTRVAEDREEIVADSSNCRATLLVRFALILRSEERHERLKGKPERHVQRLVLREASLISRLVPPH